MSDGNGLRLGHAVMDFRFHEGGRDGQEALVGFQTVLGKMEFMAMDIFLEQGDTIVITMSQTGRLRAFTRRSGWLFHQLGGVHPDAADRQAHLR